MRHYLATIWPLQCLLLSDSIRLLKVGRIATNLSETSSWLCCSRYLSAVPVFMRKNCVFHSFRSPLNNPSSCVYIIVFLKQLLSSMEYSNVKCDVELDNFLTQKVFFIFVDTLYLFQFIFIHETWNNKEWKGGLIEIVVPWSKKHPLNSLTIIETFSFTQNEMFQREVASTLGPDFLQRQGSQQVRVFVTEM